ncbi:MAG TPA: class I SAM-dependent methyltransferase [Bryobacteraceae bacterium]
MSTGRVKPELVQRIEEVGRRYNFALSSDEEFGQLLRSLARSRPGGNILEVGSGIGVGAAWLLDGMDEASSLVTIEVHEGVARVCSDLLKQDARACVVNADAVEWLSEYGGEPFDMIFADTTSVKYSRRDVLIDNLAMGGILIFDDLLPQPKWVESHHERVARFREEIFEEPALDPVILDWASGVMIAARV